MQNPKTNKTKRRLPPWARWLAGYALVVAGSVFLAYFWRVAFSQGQLPQWPLAGFIALVGSVLYLALFLICRFAGGNLCLKAALCVFVLGLLFCYANPPLQAPDETDHYLRAHAISVGRFNYDGQRTYPQDVAKLVQAFPGGYNQMVTYRAYPLVPGAFARYEASLQSGQVVQSPTEPIMFMLLPFLPQAAGMVAARLLGFGALGLLYAGRIANLLVYTLLCYVVFKNCNKYRGVFFALALLPLSLFMAASASYDSIMLVLCYLIISYFCKDEMHTKDVVVFGLAVLYATYLKPMNIVLAAVLLLVPKERWKTKWRPWPALAVVLGAALVFKFGLMEWLDGDVLKTGYPAQLPRGGGAAASTAGQLALLLQNPFRFGPVLLLTLYEQAAFLFNLGSFGSLDLFIPLASGLSVLSMAAASALGIQQKDDTKATGALALFLAAICYGGAVMLGIYVADSDVGSIRITGLQPRYFLPVLLLLFMLASILLGKAVRPRLVAGTNLARTEHITLWLTAAVALVCVLFIFQSNFIGQWLPKAEGGYKLVNLFGWQGL